MALARLVSTLIPTPTSALIAQPVLSVPRPSQSLFLALRDTGGLLEMLEAPTVPNVELATSAQIPSRKSLAPQDIGLMLDQSTAIQSLLV